MSLINDALKRASQTTKDRPSQANLPTPMEPVREPARSKSNFRFAGVSAVIVIVALAVWFLFQWFSQRHAQNQRVPAVAAAPALQRPPAAPNGSPPPATRPRLPESAAAAAQTAVHSAAPAIAAVVSPAASAAVSASAAAPVGVPSVAAAPPANPSVPAASGQPAAVAVPLSNPAPATVVLQPPAARQPSVAFPKLQVKGIFYNQTHPYALINGETVGEGEHVLGVRVVKIQPNRVTLEFNGQTKEMVLGE